MDKSDKSGKQMSLSDVRQKLLDDLKSRLGDSNLYKDIEDDGKVKQFFNYLKTKDINNINIRKIPLTAYKKRNIVHNKPHHIQMIIENPNNFVLKDLTCQYIKNELLQYEKRRKLHKNKGCKSRYVSNF